jgi:multisubunit Na+/H+ antiporter MnhE subunit
MLAVWWLVLFALWLALVDTTQLPELILGAAAAGIAALSTLVVGAVRPRAARVDPAWIRAAARAAVALFADTGLVLAALWHRLVGTRRIRGEFRSAPFRAGGEGRRDVARRALAEALGSVGPNTIVIGIDRERDTVVFHQLVRRDRALDRLELE